MAENEKQKVKPIVIDGFEINAQNVTFQKLQEFSLNLFEKLLIQRKERSFLTLERDKLRTILENTRHEIKIANLILENKNNEWDQAQKGQSEELKEIEQEVKYIDYDHNINLSEIKLWEENLSTKSESENLEDELNLLKEKQFLKQELAEQITVYEKDLRNIKNKHIQDIKHLEGTQEETKIKTELEFNRNFLSCIEQFTLKHEMEMFEVEERYNTHLVELKHISGNRTDEMKRFFNSITSENLTVISNLKDTLHVLKTSKEVMSDEVKLLKMENKNLEELLNNSKAQVNSLRRQQINYEKDIVSLKYNKALLNRTEKETKAVKVQSAAGLRKIKIDEGLNLADMSDSLLFSSLTNSRSTILSSKRQYLQKLISKLIDEIKQKQRIVKDLSCDPKIQQALSELKYEYWNPRKLAYELAALCKAHDDLLRTLRVKLHELHVPEENFANHTLLNIEMIGKSPSSFVSKQDQ